MGFANKIITKLTELGPIGFTRLIQLNATYAISNLLDRRFDLRYGTDTARPIHGPQLDVDWRHTDHGTSYFPTPEGTTKRILDRCGVDYGRYSFIEFGSGKGRVVLLAAMRPFKSVVGIEHSQLLHETATANLAQMRKRGRLRAPVELFRMDATDFEIPQDPCVFYFFNPFVGEVAHRVFEKIARRPERGEADLVIWWYSRELADNEGMQRSFAALRFVPVLSIDVKDQGGERRFVHILVRDSEPGLRLAARLCTYDSMAQAPAGQSP